MEPRTGQLFFGDPSVTAAFDAEGDWHDGGNGRYAKRGWSSAKAAILRLVRGAAAADLAARDGHADLKLHPSVPRDVMKRVAPNGKVTARYHDRTHAMVDVDGRPTLVRWDRFAEPETPVTQNMVARPELIADRIARFDGDPDEKDSIRETVETIFTMDLGDGVTTQAETSLPQDTEDYGPAAIVTGQFVYKGDEIGEFQRVLHINTETGEPTVYHETISIEPEFRGHGYGAKFIARTVDRYRDNGFVRVDTHGSSATNTAYTDGAYVWAKAGFDWDLRTYNDRRVFLRSAPRVVKLLNRNADNPPDGQPPEITAHAKQVAERLQSLINHVDQNYPLLPLDAITPEEVAAVGNKEFPVSRTAMTATTVLGDPRLIDFMYTKNIVEDRDAFQPKPEAPVTQDMGVWSRSAEEWAKDMGYNPKLIGTLETIRGGPKPFGYIESRAQNSGARGGADADIQDELYNLFADGAAAVADDRVMIRVPAEILDSIEEAGRFKSQHETGTSRGMFSPLDRERFETDVFGIKPKSPAKKAPVYGLVASDNVGTIGHSQYGEVGFLLKGDRIADRTTLSAGDSLFEAVPIPVPSVEWSGAGDDILAAAHAAAVGFVGDAMIRDRLEDRQFSTVAFEAQVHGGVTLDDVAGIVVFGPDAEPKARALADKLGVPLHVAPDSEKAMQQLRRGVDEDSLTQNSRAAYGRTTYGDILPEKPVAQDMVVAPDRTLSDYITPGVLRWAEKLADDYSWSDRERARITQLEETRGAALLWEQITGAPESRRWIDDTLKSMNPDPDAVETLQQAHLAAVHELGDEPHPFYRHSGNRFDPFSQGWFSANYDRSATSSWWRTGDQYDDDNQIKFGESRHDSNFDASQVLANIGILQDYGEYLIVDNPTVIDRLMAGQFPIAPETPVIQNMPDRLGGVFADPVVNRIIDRYTEAGHPIYVVGGAIRSVLNGEPINDVDLTTSATPEESTRILSEVGTVYPLGEKFGTVVVNTDGMDYEVTTHRTEVYDPVSRKPEVVFTDSLPEDLARRDFTFNAMAVGPDRTLIDPYNGQQDLTDKVVKAVGDPDERFTEDPLRIVRAVRFASTLGFTIEPETLAAAKRQADRLDIVSTERFKTELDKILKSVRPDTVTNAVGWAGSIGITGRMFGPLKTAAERVGVENRTRFIGVPAKYRFAALVTDASLNDDVNPLDLVGDLKRGSAEMRNIKQVVDVVANIAETRISDPAETNMVILRAVRNLNDTQLDMLKAVLPYQLGEVRGMGGMTLDAAFANRKLYRAPLPVDGNDLAGLGLKGREIGAAVRMLTDEMLRRRGRLPKHVALRLADPNRKRFATENMSLARRPGEGIVEPILRERGTARLVLSTNRLKRSMGVGVGDTLEARYDAPNSGFVIVDRPMLDGSTRAVRVSLDNFEEEVRVESLADEALRYDTPDGFADAMGAVDHPTVADRELYDKLRQRLVWDNMLSYPSPDSVDEHSILTDRKLREAARLTGVADVDVNRIINQRNVMWHSTPTGDVYAGAGYGLHVGTWQAALEAARFPGAPPDGKEFWDGTDRYDGPVNTSTGAITGEFYPNLFPLRIVGPMLNRRYDPVSDDYANSRMTAQTTKGQAKTGYYYLNHAEDAGSISAVLPDGDHIVRLHTRAELTDVWNKAHAPADAETPVVQDMVDPPETVTVSGREVPIVDAPTIKEIVETMGANDLEPGKLRARHPERYVQNAVGEWKLADGEREPELWRGTIERGRAVDRFVPVRLIDRNRGLFSNTPDGEPYPPSHLWRAISEQEWELIQQTGVIKSDGRMNLGAPGTPDDEGTVAAVRDPSWYLPGALSSQQDGNQRTGRIIRIEFRDEDGWRTDTIDEYQKTLQPVPASRIDMVSAPMTRVDGIYVSHPARPEEPVTQDMAVRPLPYTIGVPANPADRARVVKRNRTLIATRYSEVADAEDPPSLVDFTADVVAGLDSLRADGDPVVRVPWAGARGIAEGGRFKSQHETGVSTVNYNPAGRVNIEHSSLGVPVDIDPTLRPIFGVIESTYEEGARGADMYGPVTFILKRSVLDRATMSFGDSGDLDVIPVRATGDVTDDELLAAASDRAVNDIADSAVAEHLADDMWEGPDMNESGMYRELQFHGGLTLDDVEDVTYQPDDVDEPDAVAAIAAMQTVGLTPVTQWMAERPDDRTPDYFKRLGDLPIPEHIRQVGSETQDSPDETKRSRYAGMIQSLPEVRTAAATTRRDSIEVAVPYLAVTRIIQDGRLKSQHETKTSWGKLDPELRRRTESEMFGIPADQPAETMPIYGFVSEAAVFPKHYGNVFLRMKPEVADRTTVTFGDSLLTHPTSMIQPVPVDRLPEASEYELVRATPPREFSRSYDYVEAQIHGGVRLDEDVAAVVMRHDAFWDSILAAFVMADYLNLPVTVTDKVSMVMFHREVAGLRSMYPELNNVELAYEVPRMFRAKPGMLREDMSAIELLGAAYTLDDIRRLLKDGSLTERQRDDLNNILETRETMQ